MTPNSSAPLVGIVMGSRSDWETMQHAAQKFDALGVPYEVKVVSAHRTPDVLFTYAEQAGPRIVTLATVQVRPTAEQRADLLVHTAAATAQAATGHAAAALGALVGQVIVNLPVPQLQPTPVELEALVSATLGQ